MRLQKQMTLKRAKLLKQPNRLVYLLKTPLYSFLQISYIKLVFLKLCFEINEISLLNLRKVFVLLHSITYQKHM